MVQMEQAVKSGIADMVLMGIEPTYPSEKYGYIVPEAHPVIDGRLIAWPVDRFQEKPSLDKARTLLDEGFWIS